jgi:TAG lipase / steryl ester hydrolase / phospholipase A2 / LPA acyltransferase
MPIYLFTFWLEVRRLYGRSALLLSGGATFGLYHLGVIKALVIAGILPRVISGSSAGSLGNQYLQLQENIKSDWW